jgi:hypothetical protein
MTIFRNDNVSKLHKYLWGAGELADGRDSCDVSGLTISGYGRPSILFWDAFRDCVFLDRIAGVGIPC